MTEENDDPLVINRVMSAQDFQDLLDSYYGPLLIVMGMSDRPGSCAFTKDKSMGPVRVQRNLFLRPFMGKKGWA